jgi:formylglycine-generating enzyme required for sulfatase activity
VLHPAKTGLIVGALAVTAACVAHPGAKIRDDASGIELVRLPAGEFVMGTPENEAGREPQEIAHRVRLTKAFYLGVTEVTQRQWSAIMNGNPSHFTACGPECPVERVNFHEVEAFIAKLNARSGGGFRLPTEAEWEYACRAGGSAPFGARRTLSAADANIDGRFPYGAAAAPESAGTMRVGRFRANAFGLRDMSGNVWEWTADWHCPYPAEAATDPIGRCESPHRVIRGGSWKFDGNSARCGLRYTHRPQDRGFSLGFRVAKDAQ